MEKGNGEHCEPTFSSTTVTLDMESPGTHESESTCNKSKSNETKKHYDIAISITRVLGDVFTIVAAICFLLGSIFAMDSNIIVSGILFMFGNIFFTVGPIFNVISASIAYRMYKQKAILLNIIGICGQIVGGTIFIVGAGLYLSYNFFASRIVWDVGAVFYLASALFMSAVALVQGIRYESKGSTKQTIGLTGLSIAAVLFPTVCVVFSIGTFVFTANDPSLNVLGKHIVDYCVSIDYSGKYSRIDREVFVQYEQ
ncbi:hypothetical protein AKO1_014668 [Acrasis kona]|uniref:Uncharacterized protein n=1 Tax=Acrasis kona TaxID=1008807 RepID=A0AAW2Z291_9EUKA